jgi:hypothetical protein
MGRIGDTYCQVASQWGLDSGRWMGWEGVSLSPGMGSGC